MASKALCDRRHRAGKNHSRGEKKNSIFYYIPVVTHKPLILLKGLSDTLSRYVFLPVSMEISLQISIKFDFVFAVVN